MDSLKTVSLFAFMLMFGLVNSTVLINSMDGRDVVIGTYYAAVIKDNVFFVPKEAPLEMITAKLKGIDDKIILIEGKVKVMPELKVLLENSGYTIERVIESKDPLITNVNLANDIKGLTSGYIIVSEKIGYNTVAPIPYARAHDYFLIFDSVDLNYILDLTKNQNVLVYGEIKKGLLEELKRNSHVLEINKGDKYLDNIELVKMLLNERGKTQLILTDGNFLDYTIMNTEYPILYVSTAIPKSVKDFLKEEAKKGRVEILVLIGAELSDAVYTLKKEINKELGEEKLRVFMKLGEAYPKISPNPFPIPIFPLPSPYAAIEAEKVLLNRVNNVLTVVFVNKGNVKGFFTYSIKVLGNDEVIQTFSNDNITSLSPGEKTSVDYPLDIPRVFEGTLKAEVTVTYGISRTVLDNIFFKSFEISKITFEDKSNLKLNYAKYNPDLKYLELSITNLGENPAYYKIFVEYKDKEGNDLVFEDVVKEIAPGVTKVERINELEAYGDLRVKIKYGELDYSLKKEIEEKVKVSRTDYLLYAVALIGLLILLYLIIKKFSQVKQGVSDFVKTE